jgi:oligopeptide/dipeptide ABC transporter ATP-binding protein
MAVLLITHDMGVVAQMADRVAVMYAGQVVERAPADRLFAAPRHPYAHLLLRAIPSARMRQETLPVIAGGAPQPGRYPPGCRFAPRCPLADDACREAIPPLARVAEAHLSRCIRPEAVAGLALAGAGA